VTSGDPGIAAWLLDQTGIDAESLGANAIARTVGLRAAAVLAANGTRVATMPAAWEGGAAVPEWALDAYWSHLTTTAAERQALIDALVVPETWFFREREAFAALARLGVQRVAEQPGVVLRILSVPCSSGEEPYSAAMALLDAGLAGDQFAIDAIDISATLIEAAERGVYGRNAFRGDRLGFRDRHFEVSTRGWRIGMDVRRQVTFERANLFGWLAVHPVSYDFVFCRNVLIYFDREAQDRAVGLLRARLAKDGMIFVGPAETGIMMRHEMVPAYIPLSFGYRLPLPGKEPMWTAATPRSAASNRAAAPLPLRPLHARPFARASAALPLDASASTRGAQSPPLLAQNVPHAPKAVARTSARVKGKTAGKTAGKNAPKNAENTAAKTAAIPRQATLADARRLADAGDLDAAHRLALQAAHAAAPDADAWYLLGLIADAQGHPAQARDHYRKAVYLDPVHYEALTHLAALLDVQGDADSARRLMHRAGRAAPRTPRHGAADD
jgi:chemotaxis protein methyltransferase WspC